MSISLDEAVVALTAPDGARELAHVGHEASLLALGYTTIGTGAAADLATLDARLDAIDLRRLALGAAAGAGTYAIVAVLALSLPPGSRAALGLVAIFAALFVAGRVARPRTPSQWALTGCLSVAATVMIVAVLLTVVGR